MKLSVLVHSNSKKPRIEIGLRGVLHVYVNEPPLEGRANRAVTEALAKYFQVPKSRVVMVKGTKSKQKMFEIN